MGLLDNLMELEEMAEVSKAQTEEAKDDNQKKENPEGSKSEKINLADSMYSKEFYDRYGSK